MLTIKNPRLFLTRNSLTRHIFSSSGFMLIELLIALTLSALLLKLILEIFLTNMHSYHLQRTLNQVQDNAKTAIDILSTEIQHAGYMGCARLTHDFPMASSLSYTLTSKNKLFSPQGHELVVSHMSLSTALLMESVSDATTLTVSNHVLFTTGDVLMIADCKHAEIFQAAEVKMVNGKQVISSAHSLHYQYDQEAEVGQLDMNTYYIADTERRHLDGTPVYALFVKDHQGTFELVENVQQMTIRFSINNGNGLVELPANEITDSSHVVGVAIDLSMVLSPIKKNWYAYVSV